MRRNRVPWWALLLGWPLFAYAVAPAHPGQAPSTIGWVRWDSGTKASVWLVGGYLSRQRWIEADRARGSLLPSTRFEIYGLEGRRGVIRVGAAESGQEVGGWLARGTHTMKGSGEGVALANVSSPLPRVPRPQSLSAPLYREAAASLLRGKGLPVRQAHLAQHLRIDLNGDGVDEVLLCAASRPNIGGSPGASRGDYSLAALRFVDRSQGGKVRLTPLALDAYPRATREAAPLGYKIIGCLDINGDGKQEIVLEYRYYEGNGIEVFSFDGRSVRRVLRAGWGV